MVTTSYGMNPGVMPNTWGDAQRLNPLATSPRAGTTGTTGWGYQQTNAPGWTGNPDAWNTSKSGAPMSMFGGTIGGGQLQDVYSTQPVGPTGQPRQPVPARPDATLPPVSTNPVGPNGQPMPTYNVPAWNQNVPTPYATPAASIGTPTWGAMFPTGFQNTPEWWADPKNQAAMANSLPALAYDWNRYTYANDFTEASKRWAAENAWKQQADQFGMSLAAQQQAQSEAQDALAAQQWNKQYEFQTGQAAIENDLAYKAQAIDQAYKDNLITIDQRRVAIEALQQQATQQYQQGLLYNDAFANQATAAYQQGLLANQQAQMQNDLIAARYAAFGRAQAPGGGRTTWYRNW